VGKWPSVIFAGGGSFRPGPDQGCASTRNQSVASGAWFAGAARLGVVGQWSWHNLTTSEKRSAVISQASDPCVRNIWADRAARPPKPMACQAGQTFQPSPFPRSSRGSVGAGGDQFVSSSRPRCFRLLRSRHRPKSLAWLSMVNTGCRKSAAFGKCTGGEGPFGLHKPLKEGLGEPSEAGAPIPEITPVNRDTRPNRRQAQTEKLARASPTRSLRPNSEALPPQSRRETGCGGRHGREPKPAFA